MHDELSCLAAFDPFGKFSAESYTFSEDTSTSPPFPSIPLKTGTFGFRLTRLLRNSLFPSFFCGYARKKKGGFFPFTVPWNPLN